MKRNIWMRALALLLVFSITGCGVAKGDASQEQNVQVESVISSDSLGSDSSNVEPEESTYRIEEPVNDATTSGESEDTNSEDTNTADTNTESKMALDEAQKNSIAMLNFLAVLSQEINSSKNSRMFLEEAYAALINNTNPEGVNELTESHLASLLDIIEKYRMITVKRDRLQYIYEQNKAKALKEAMPNPIALLSAVNSFDFKRLAASVIYMAVDSYSSYKAYNADLDLQYLQDGWELDDEEAENVHENRKRAFMFMIDIVREEHLPGKLALNESSVEEYVNWKNETNTYQKIQFFESQKSTYEAFGDYWLTLASCYYEHEDYKKCLECFDTYEELQADIFRKDYNLAKALPLAIVAAKEVYSKEEYVPVAERYLATLVENTENAEWSLKYFAAQMYMDLYAQTKNDNYLKSAYDLVINNVNYLVAEQKALNKEYMDPVKEVSLPADPSKDASKEESDSIKDEKKKIKEYNKALNERRKVELPPVYEPLVLNCDLLFGLAEEMQIPASERTKIEGILHQGGSALFYTKPVDNLYTFSPDEVAIDAGFDKDSLTMPVTCLSEKSFVRVTVTEGGQDSVYEDWQVKKVDRKSEDVDSFVVTLTSKACGKQSWSADSTVKVEIFDEEGSDRSPLAINFKVSSYKKIAVMPATVKFEQVR